MYYTDKIQKAIRFATETHEICQKQKRKGKDIPYITHPLTVGLILARASVDEDVVVAGILHDTIEDSIPGKKVTYEMLQYSFGERVADLVGSVTEKRKDMPWADRKRDALEDIKGFSHDSVMLKSADVISNLSELIEDYWAEGKETFERFNAPREDILGHSKHVIDALLAQWPESPLAEDLREASRNLSRVAELTSDSFPQYFLANQEVPIRIDSDGKELWATNFAFGNQYPIGRALRHNNRITEAEAMKYAEELRGAVRT
jgi:hypothetical protein